MASFVEGVEVFEVEGVIQLNPKEESVETYIVAFFDGLHAFLFQWCSKE